MNTIETRIKSLLKQKDMVMTELSKADVPSSHLSVHDTQKSDGVKFSKLVLNSSALMATCNPKVLIPLVRGLNSYFDQHPGSYTLTRIFMNYKMQFGRAGLHFKYKKGGQVSTGPNNVI